MCALDHYLALVDGYRGEFRLDKCMEPGSVEVHVFQHRMEHPFSCWFFYCDICTRTMRRIQR